MSDEKKIQGVRPAGYFVDEVPAFTPGGIVNGPQRVTEDFLTRPHGDEKTSERAQELFNQVTGNAYRAYMQQSEEQLKDVVRKAMKLVEQNPRNEPMRAEISRPAVERMLAEDLSAFGNVPQVAGLATVLFDAGWRPTIDRLVR